MACSHWQQSCLKACPHKATKLPKTATNYFRKRQQIVAENGNKVLPFRATMLPFSATIASATICFRFRQLSCLVWTGFKMANCCPKTATLLPFRATMLPFSATIAVAVSGDYSRRTATKYRRFRQRLLPFSATLLLVWTGL